MKTPYRNIYQILKLNRFIVLSVVICSAGSSIFAVWKALESSRKLLDSSFAVNTDGSIIPLKLVDQKENLEVEARSHLQLFHTYFYELTTSNFEGNIEKALWLGDASVDEVYLQKRSEGFYNRILQYSLVHRVNTIRSQLDLSSYPYEFQSVIDFEVLRGKVTDKYQLTTTGNLLRVDRNFPHNTHGLLITNFFEKGLKKIEDETE